MNQIVFSAEKHWDTYKKKGFNDQQIALMKQTFKWVESSDGQPVVDGWITSRSGQHICVLGMEDSFIEEDDYFEMKNPEAYDKMVFKLRGDITADQLKDEFFSIDGNLATRGEDMGWAHQIDLTTRIVSFVDPEYAKKYEERIGGLKAFIRDLIQKGWVKKYDA